jgi:hypothetical protein
VAGLRRAVRTAVEVVGHRRGDATLHG